MLAQLSQALARARALSLAAQRSTLRHMKYRRLLLGFLALLLVFQAGFLIQREWLDAGVYAFGVACYVVFLFIWKRFANRNVKPSQ
jgi:hypothetical protein